MATGVGTVIDGKYEILKQIGKGGMSTVFLAMDKRLNKQWAIKEIRKNGNGKNDEVVVNSLIAEANLMKRLDHPTLPRIVDIIDNGTTIYVIMDYIEGESLDKVLAEYGAISQDLVIDWAKQICDAFSYLHSQKPPIIYRDMKPANVMLKPEGNIKIIDFGIAREYKETNLADTTVLGTRGFASPEHYGARQTDARSDIYTIGMTMHNLLTGVDPRQDNYIYAPIRQWNPELSGGLERIIDKCVSPDPKDRYQNCDELLYALEHYEVIDDDYKKNQKRKLSSFIVSISLAVIMAVVGISGLLLSSKTNKDDYNNQIAINTQESLSHAIELYPGKSEAYIDLLNLYKDDYIFSKEESDTFSSLYNYNEFEQNAGTESNDYLDLAFEVAITYFGYYSKDGTENYQINDNVNLSYNYFKYIVNTENTDYDNYTISKSFYDFCTQYK
ncbi:MAG: serine/threonine protein kinase, partial [Clostridiales bacterium]|nr:serine/threonine protein kinase [Clostridiales bacterium]